ncbi:MAG: hypothetical protein N7Q72_01690 [Spiroplasma sp. Tabriz.8]|nr:hypothetical protein [Spiroplasma sp. Tabriz.8]
MIRIVGYKYWMWDPCNVKVGVCVYIYIYIYIGTEIYPFNNIIGSTIYNVLLKITLDLVNRHVFVWC